MATTDELTQGYLILSGDEDLPATKVLDCGCCATSLLYSLDAYDLDGEFVDSSPDLVSFEVEDEVRRLFAVSNDAETVRVFAEDGTLVTEYGRTNRLDAI